jgi:hypothetical protein
MKLSVSVRNQLRRINLPTLSLIALLQRTPAPQVVANVEEWVIESPIGTVLKSFAAIAASLGAMNSLAGATPLAPSAGSATGTTVTAGTAVSISFTVSPTQTPIQSWKVGGTIPPGLDFSGLTAAGTVNISNLKLSGTPTTAGSYPVTLQAFDGKNATGFESAIYNYSITVNAATNTAPTITTQPLSQTVNVGSNVTFSVTATGSPAPTYQWRKDDVDIASATSSSLALSNVQTTAAGTYKVVVTNTAGSVTSNGAVLTVNQVSANAPGVPANAGAFASNSTQITITWLAPASGGAPTGYKLERATDEAFSAGLATITLATAATSYVDGTVSGNTKYYYRLSASNSSGTSNPTAAFSATTPASTGSGTSRLVNIATRAFCGTDANVAIAGFVIGGTGKKQVLLRAVGPSLIPQGLPQAETLADPTMQLYKGATVIATNDDWGTNENAAQITSVGNSIGAAAFAGSDTKSAALLMSLDPGAYTFVVNGKNNTTGVVLLEVYDADTSNTAAYFVNIATRAYSTTGSGVTIGGFVLSGSKPKQILMRALGPTLEPLGINRTQLLMDPMMEMHQGAPLIAVNDNWSDNANASAITTTGARIGALGIDGADTKSAVLLVNAQPGVYTFIASGKSNTSGIVLVEVYDAD